MTDTPPAAPPASAPEPKAKGGFWRWIGGRRRWAIALIPIALLVGINIGQSNAAPVASVDASSDLQDDLNDANQRIDELEREADALAQLEADLAAREAAIAAREAAADEADAAANANTFGDGTYLVGVDIQAGTYRTTVTGNCYWERLSGLSGSFEDLIANDLPTGSAIVEIAASDLAFSTQGCGTWEKIS